ncbi:sigma-70 family RNA polymerase sigma factor [Rhodococcus hoagii]|uniref:RNA polymerase sigma factor ShbA n=1 Tax=Rhodococcus hoagii TaxID=43767 RepID=UPI0019E090EA|nr:RNA polymerase sigma factor ShbA [Prescottella equi]NKR63382.1 sigma-70 family RNA polymerase sigma factor [Prescottella equi]NKR77326.1 sigma-70 family RNA polymerase sigma factor [Prescottella equi]NKR93164.1 sigma-70 family RNA polymerase sigma factor [Prescottella equi]NKT01897.1 sigma-70 family RNA polymerase sigma factor [Prescottella equi]NKZ65840.1 sigma-70 family RNA polymerase sigma factor [Prescottella equi]
MSSTFTPPPVRAVDLDAVAAAARAGHDDAMAELMARVRPMVLRFCRSRLRGSRCLSAEDVTQEVCIAVMRALPGYEDRGRFTAFVFGIASHKIVDALRAFGRDKSVPVDIVPEVPVEFDTPEEHAMRAHDTQHAWSLIDVLTARERTILRLRIVEQQSAAETARVLNTTAGAVRVAQHRALNRLRAQLASR